MARMSVYMRIMPAVFLVSPYLIFNVCCSQTIISPQNPGEKNFLVRTKQFNEFVDRFNYKTNFNGNHIDSDFMSKFPRDKMIHSLCDLKDPRIDQNSTNWSKNYFDKKTEFIDEVIHKNLLIHKYSDKIIAEAKSHIIYRGKLKTISIFLTQEIVGNDRVKWVIRNVKGDFLIFNKTDTSYIRFIQPSSNETDFINLKRALEDIDHLKDYASRDYEPDNLSVFFYMINSGIVRFEYVDEVVYHILDIPGWCIKVKELNRYEMNSGWLITDITKTDLGIKEYIESLN
jgi:hypothetical protein